jgi:hypothetical protein
MAPKPEKEHDLKEVLAYFLTSQTVKTTSKFRDSCAALLCPLGAGAPVLPSPVGRFGGGSVFLFRPFEFVFNSFLRSHR